MADAPDALDERYHGLPPGLGQRIEALPTEPGVYIMKDRSGEVIYVGKAVSLRARVKSYFSGQDTRAFVALLNRVLGDLEVVLVRSEKEALLLEQQFIKQHHPRFNVVHRDDKSFITLAVNEQHTWPRVDVTRTHTLLTEGPRPGHRYFGPYSSASSVRATLRVLNHHFNLRTCTDHTLTHRSRPCLEYQIGRCPAPCVFEVPQDVYRQNVADALLFLSGRRDVLVRALRTRMEEASAQLRFEDAARLRDQMRDVERTMEKQVVADSDGEDLDVLGLHREGNVVALGILNVRAGRVLGKDTLVFKDAEFPDDELLLQVLDARYATASDVPRLVLLPLELPEDERAVRETMLAEKRGTRVDLVAPQRGDKRALLEIATRNAKAALEDKGALEARRKDALHRLQQRLRLSRRPTVMECFDISLFQGSQPVASQVTFVDGAPDKSRYRRYAIKTVTGTDDFAMMFEVVTRRLKRALQTQDWPDLMVMDGGRGQLNAALAACRDLGIPVGPQAAQALHAQAAADGTPRWPDPQRYVELCSLAKARALDAQDGRGYAGRDAVTQEAPPEERWEEGGEDGSLKHSPERVFLPDVKDPLALRNNTAELHLMAQLRDEAHRFAITFHRQRRKGSTLRSALDDVPGIGPTRRRALLRHFGSLTAVQAATLEQLVAAPGMTRGAAAAVYAALHPTLDDPANT